MSEAPLKLKKERERKSQVMLVTTTKTSEWWSGVASSGRCSCNGDGEVKSGKSEAQKP